MRTRYPIKCDFCRVRRQRSGARLRPSAGGRKQGRKDANFTFQFACCCREETRREERTDDDPSSIPPFFPPNPLTPTASAADASPRPTFLPSAAACLQQSPLIRPRAPSSKKQSSLTLSRVSCDRVRISVSPQSTPQALDISTLSITLLTMYWSAAMSLKTPPREKTPNYGSFSGASRTLTSASRTSSGSNIRIPQSIPEHQCLLHFASPRLQHCEEEKLAEYYEMEQAANYASNHKSNSSATTTVTVTASKTLQMLLLSSSKLEQYYSSASSTTSTSSTSSSSSQNSEHSYVELHSSDLDHSSSSSTSHNSASLFSYLNGSFGSEPTHEIAAARAAGEDADQLNYWMLERERLRAKRERRHLLSKKAALSGAKVADDEPASAWRTGAIMCSVPLLLIILFVIFVLLSGEGSASAVAPSAWEMIVTTVTGKTSDNSSSATSAEIAHAALRGSG